MSISRIFVTRFFQLVTERQFAEAERVLERLRLKTQKNERNRGYLQALYGILLTKKSDDDQSAFLSNLNPDNKDELKNYRREFLKHAQNGLHSDYDRGFFSAWADYLRTLMRMKENTEASK